MKGNSHTPRDRSPGKPQPAGAKFLRAVLRHTGKRPKFGSTRRDAE